MQVVILCGGKGMRMGCSSQAVPKALFPIGERPILWHIMKYYTHFGYNDFVLCLGYKGDQIVKYFRNNKDFRITFIDTGIAANTGDRIRQIRRRIKTDVFFATYGDGLSSVNLRDLLAFHRRRRSIATLTRVRPPSPFGVLDVDFRSGIVRHFDEKPRMDQWINGGFFVFNIGIFRYVRKGDILESDTFSRLAKARQLTAYRHDGFWQCMDTYKDHVSLNQLWRSPKAAWAVWKGR